MTEYSTFEEVKEILIKWHLTSKFTAEFIICVGKPEAIIFEIKSGTFEEVETSWIGDSAAYIRFQGYFLNKIEAKPVGPMNTVYKDDEATMIIGHTNYTIQEVVNVEKFSKMSKAMDSVADEGLIESVGGFRILVVFENEFKYKFYSKNYQRDIRYYDFGEHIVGHGTASEGAFTLNFFGCSKDYKTLAFHIKQANYGISYYRESSGLFTAETKTMDEVDFQDYLKQQFGFAPTFNTQDRLAKFITDGRNAFNGKMYQGAIKSYEKALNEVTDKIKKSNILYQIGVCYLNLKQQENALRTFQKVIDLNSSWQKIIMQHFVKPK